MDDSINERIGSMIEIQGGYTSYVDLKLELFDDSRNIGRMSRYRPVVSHRQAFESLAQSLNVQDGRCYLLTGAYGTGKSHLCLMFANYLKTPSGEKPMPEFFAHYQEADREAAADLRSKRRTGNYLIALCEWGGHGDFEEIVLRAVDQALLREGFNEDFDTHYLQAVKKVEEWQRLEQESDPRGRFMDEFRLALESLTPVQTVDRFLNCLRSFDYTALSDFKRIHREITTVPFTYDKSNLISILTETLSSQKFKEKFLGLLVLFDEFGDTMEQGNLSPKMFQQFAQFAAETPPQCARLIFIATAHKSLIDYAKEYDTTEFRTASDRIKEVPLTPNGIEDIISAIVKVRTDHHIWNEKVAPRFSTFDSFLPDCTRLKLFDPLNGPQVRKKIIEAIYPMHPMATFALIRLARDIASNNRSVFTFFAGDLSNVPASGSYGEFISSQPPEISGRLNLYTADLLFEYFAAKLTSDNRELRETLLNLVRDYETSVRELNEQSTRDMESRLLLQEDPLIPRILRLMLLYNLIQVPRIPATVQNLAFGLNYSSEAEKILLKNRLQELSTRGILYYLKDKDEYEFRKSGGVNLDQLVTAYKRELQNRPSNLVAELLLLAPVTKNDLFLVANDYNIYREDKRLIRRLVRVADLGSEVDTPFGQRNFFEQQEAELEAEARKSEFEGVAVYVACETPDEIQRAHDLCARNKSDRVVVAIPRRPLPMLDIIMEVRALKYLESPEQSKDFTSQDKSALSSRLHGDGTRKGALPTLNELRDHLLNHREVQWYGKLANPLPVEEAKVADAANRVMEKLYSAHRNRFSHDDFNKVHFRIDKAKNIALKEAVEILVDFTEPIIIDISVGQQRGERRYLESCFLQNGVLDQVKAESSKLRCEFAKDISKFASKLPFLAAMIQDIQNLSPTSRFNLSDWITKYRKPPFGQGSVALVLALASIRRYFGDSILIKQDDTSIIGMPLREFDQIVNLVDGIFPQAFLTYRPLSVEEHALAAKVFTIFGNPSNAAAAAQGVTLQMAYNALLSWWQGLPPLACSSQLYTTTPGYHTSFIAVMESIAAKDPHTFLLDDLPTAFGADSGFAITQVTVDLLSEQLPQIKLAFEQAIQGVEDRIIAAVRQMFGSEQFTYSGIIDTIAAWYNSLDSNQRDAYAAWHTNDSKPLIIHLKTLSGDLRQTFLELIPASADYGLKRVPDWLSDHVDEYVERLRRGKKCIEYNKIKVESPELHLSGNLKREDATISFVDKVVLTLKPKKPGDRIYLTEGNADPKSTSSPRAEHLTEFTFEIKDRKTIKYVACDADGNYGIVETIELVNEAKKHEINIQENYIKGAVASFTFPKDSDGFTAACRSLFHLSLQRKALTAEQLEAIVKALLSELHGS